MHSEHFPLLPVAGGIFLLTFPFIERLYRTRAELLELGLLLSENAHPVKR
jgi:hypothetical protein